MFLRRDFAAYAAISAKDASFIEDRLAAQADPLLFAAGIDAAVSEIPKRPAAVAQRAMRIEIRGPLIDFGQLPELLAETRIGRVTRVRDRARKENESQRLVLLPVPVGRELGQVAETRLLGAQSLLLLFERGSHLIDRTAELPELGGLIDLGAKGELSGCDPAS